MKSLRGFKSLAMLGVVFTSSALWAQVPSPEQFFGFKMGDDHKLARYDKIVDYFNAVAAKSDRVHVRNLGPTTLGKPFVMAEISSGDTVAHLDHYKDLEKKLYFQGGAPTDAERDTILASGKAVVLITNNIHSTEIGSSQESVELLYKLATDDSPRVKKILDNVILLLVPSLNPDGQQLVVDWYNKYLGTPNEGAQTPFLWHPYVGHDDNRDEYLFSQKESRLIAEVLWHDWFPSVWLDEHQQGSEGSRIFTMPATDPINPNVDPLIYRLTTVYGQEQAAALELAGKDGITYNSTYTNFWPGAMAWTGWWHNQIGLLTEVASARIASPIYQKKADLKKDLAEAQSASGGRSLEAPDRFASGEQRPTGAENDPLPAPKDITARLDYPRPWLGGEWRLKDIVDYELIATLALLDTAADNRPQLLTQIYGINQRTIAEGKDGDIGFGTGKAYAAILPLDGQHDENEISQLVDKLLIGGVEIYKSNKDFEQDGHKYAAGSYVIPFNQVFGRYVKDLLEKQTYPEVHRAPGAPAEAPYDVSAWSLGLQFGVNTVYAKTSLPQDLALEKVEQAPKPKLEAAKTKGGWVLDYNGADDARVVNRLLKAGAHVSLVRDNTNGRAYAVVSGSSNIFHDATADYQVVDATAAPKLDAGVAVRQPRIGLYQSWTANMDEGWTRWVLEHYEFPYTTLHNTDVKSGKLHDRFDVLVLPDARVKEILGGRDNKTTPTEYKGGIGEEGWKSIEQFLHDGGTVIALGDASDLLLNKLPLPVNDVKATLKPAQHFAPGTIVNLQVDTTSPIGLGVSPATYGFYINSPFFQLTEGFASQQVDVVARYPNTEVKASGWLRGEEFQLGQAAVVSARLNPGKVVLFGIRPQHRAQTHATFPLFFNALYWSTEQDGTGSGAAVPGKGAHGE
ncbi:M14 family metallopeptidase [Silvibacterium acidisoli]|uniref:M14 family metallopeptidase n=1 Tax=Acidobacteriaceae bacterium ZG23-2 TaxID=2883246 RepID=UPI00406CE6CB